MSSKLSDLVDNLIILIIKIAKNTWKEKILDKNVNLLDLEIIDSITNVKNAMKHLLNQ